MIIRKFKCPDDLIDLRALQPLILYSLGRSYCGVHCRKLDALRGTICRRHARKISGSSLLHMGDSLKYSPNIYSWQRALKSCRNKNYLFIVPKPRLSTQLWRYCCVPSMGFYDGYLGPGAGMLYALGGVALRGKTLVSATATVKC
jgi:hypothetical protein